MVKAKWWLGTLKKRVKAWDLTRIYEKQSVKEEMDRDMQAVISKMTPFWSPNFNEKYLLKKG